MNTAEKITQIASLQTEIDGEIRKTFLRFKYAFRATELIFEENFDRVHSGTWEASATGVAFRGATRRTLDGELETPVIFIPIEFFEDFEAAVDEIERTCGVKADRKFV
jgi:hypothetical protein